MTNACDTCGKAFICFSWLRANKRRSHRQSFLTFFSVPADLSFNVLGENENYNYNDSGYYVGLERILDTNDIDKLQSVQEGVHFVCII